VAFLLGMSAFGALGLLWSAPTLAPLLHLSAGSLQALTGALLLALVAFVGLCHRRRWP
jgi:phosphatidylglycerol lysyltransferase